MKPSGKWSKKWGHEKAHFRKKYADPSRAFQAWVKSLGFEKTFLGQGIAWLDRRLGVRRLALMTLFSLILSSLIFSQIDFVLSPKLGSVSIGQIVSPVAMDLVDQVATEEKRKEAENLVPLVFDYDLSAYEGVFERIFASFSDMRRRSRQVVWPEPGNRREEAVKDFFVHRTDFEKALERQVSARSFEWLVQKQFSVRIENALVQILADLNRFRLVDGVNKYIPEKVDSVLVRYIRDGVVVREGTLPKGQMREISTILDEELTNSKVLQSLDQADQRRLRSLVEDLVIPNLTYNLSETTDRRRKARDGVLPIQRKIDKGQVIVAEGQVVQPIHLLILDRIRELKSSRRTEFMTLAAAALLVVMVFVFLSYLKRFTVNRVVVDSRDLMAMGAVSLFVVLLVKLFLLLVSEGALDKIAHLNIPGNAAIYLAPLALGSMLVGLLLTSGEVVWLYTLFMAVVLSMLSDFNYGAMTVALVGGVAAGRGVMNCQTRSQIYIAGLRVGVIQALVVGLLTILQRVGDPGVLVAMGWNIAAGLLSGLLTALIAMSVVPLFESMFNYTTDIKLLELASLNHPLMKEMIVKAPGTYHHSLVVGSMCEAAAEKIGANPLLAKVMAYYHDIGKTAHAQYFIENQRPGFNPHDHISPHMSKTILVAHVKDGAELGLKHRLGRPIIDGVLQHHGTTLISYFYNKALEEQDADVDHIHEDDFRYPGPKPQFREAALVMLADSIEAAARSLDEPTATRLQNIVKNVIQTKFLDGQLDECNLTLKDLTIIERSFKKILLGVYHQRIDYPLKYSAAEGRSTTGTETKGPKKGSHSA